MHLLNQKKSRVLLGHLVQISKKVEQTRKIQGCYLVYLIKYSQKDLPSSIHSNFPMHVQFQASGINTRVMKFESYTYTMMVKFLIICLLHSTPIMVLSSFTSHIPFSFCKYGKLLSMHVVYFGEYFSVKHFK